MDWLTITPPLLAIIVAVWTRNVFWALGIAIWLEGMSGSSSEQIVLHKTAVVNGNLDSPIVIMEEGAQLNGNVKMGKAASSAGKSSTPTAAPTNDGAAKGGDGSPN